MRKGRTLALVALATFAFAGLHGVGQAVARDMGVTRAAKSAKADAGDAKRASALRQFTGYVTAIDQTTITVEKRGKNPEARTFVKLDGLRTTGDVAKDARVTVYYRDDGAKAVAHRVVAKPERSRKG